MNCCLQINNLTQVKKCSLGRCYFGQNSFPMQHNFPSSFIKWSLLPLPNEESYGNNNNDACHVISDASAWSCMLNNWTCKDHRFQQLLLLSWFKSSQKSWPRTVSLESTVHCSELTRECRLNATALCVPLLVHDDIDSECLNVSIEIMDS